MLDRYIKPFFAAWGEPDADARAAIIRDSLADDFVYSDPEYPRHLKDVDELISYISMYMEIAPGGTVRVVKLYETGRSFLATVEYAKPSGEKRHGQYFIEIDDETRLKRLVGFVDQGGTA